MYYSAPLWLLLLVSSAVAGVSNAPVPCPGDADGDLVVTFADVTTVLANWGASGPLGDSNSDGLVDFDDVSETIANWQIDCAASFATGSNAVARRIVLQADGACRLYLVGDSLSSDSYSAPDTTNTSLQYGIVRNWTPANWSGIYITANGSGGDRYSFSTLTPGAVVRPGELFEGLGSRLAPIGAADVTFKTDQSPFGPFAQFYTQHLATRYAAGAWTSGRALTARLIYLMNPLGAVHRARSWRPVPTIVGELQPFHGPFAEVAIGFEDVPIPAGAPDNVGVGVYGAFPDIDDTGARYISLGARIFDPSNSGFELVIAGLGGSTPRDHTTAGGPTFGYTDESLRQFLVAVESNTFWVLLGQNQGDGTSMGAQLNAGDPTIYRQYLLDIVERYRTAAIAAGAQNPMFLLLNAYKTGYTDINAQTRFLALREIAESRTDCLALDLFTLGGPDTAEFLVDGVHCNHAGSDHFAKLIWQTLQALANRAEPRP